ncbi:protein phosphatase 1 regulatory subunit 42-like [Anoplophora glabripennis]|uniref:protein phosphatase 1 regulatory subunit 42-like n=1 Tax=Anoplophora glabripennis TaxID=217634 RepID=UPI00087593C8|nr:protein phosphatase 1 regulatory subunit 42-like [Anoplophora glabripennis]
MESGNNKKQSTKVAKNKTNSKNGLPGKCSHLYMQEKLLKKIPKLSFSKDLAVIYLYSNEIENIENLNFFPNLTSLYLQNNKIEKIENLEGLVKLRKLYIGRNKISVLEGLETLKNVEELHIEKQCLPDNTPLFLDPRTIFSLSESLCVLNISHNNLTSLSYLSPLKNLVIIDASFNDFEDIKDICQTVRDWYHLREATFIGNPITKRHRYREDIIANSVYLDSLDAKTVSAVTRNFIRRFEEEKLIHGSRQNINIADIVPSLPKNYPPPLQKAVSASILRNSKCRLSQDLSVFDETDAVYIAWKTLPQRKPLLKTPQRLRNKRNMNTDKKRVVINTFPEIAHI